MPTDLVMPELSPGMEKGDLVRWAKQEGERFLAGDVLAEVETDKAIVEIPAPSAGRLLRIVVPEGTRDVKVAQVIALLSSEADAPGAPTPESRPAIAQAQPADASGRRFASPLARRLAKETGIALGDIQGSGPRGRIVERDVAAHAARSKDDSHGLAAGTYDAIPHDSMRRAIAARVAEAARTIPQFSLSLDCNLDELLALRASQAHAPSLNVYFLKAYACALKTVPEANVAWTDAAMLRLRRIDIGIAVALPDGGLITPVVCDVDAKDVAALAAETATLIERTRRRELRPGEFQAAATAISNLGMFGIRQFNAIVTSPHSSMLALGAARRGVQVRDGQMHACWTMTATLTCDHRAIDGALGARLLDAFRQALENPASR